VDFVSVTSVTEAVAHLAEHGDSSQVLAGGTDVMIQQMRREITPLRLLHVGGITDLGGITTNGVIRIGPLTTHRSLATDPTILRAAPALASAAATVGGWQTQAVGTIGGNVCNASPAADTVPPLLVAGASFELSSATGSRTVAGDDFFIERRLTARRPDELLTAITFDPPPERTGESYLKVGRRSAMEVAIVGVAVRLTLDVDGTVERARVAACSVAPRPFRVTAAEAALQGSRLEPEAVEQAGADLVAAASPIDDTRATASYRLRILPGVLARCVAEAATQAEGVPS
jgi:carbon-monoxide dehydrogenase medium subunit